MTTTSKTDCGRWDVAVEVAMMTLGAQATDAQVLALATELYRAAWKGQE